MMVSDSISCLLAGVLTWSSGRGTGRSSTQCWATVWRTAATSSWAGTALEWGSAGEGVCVCQCMYLQHTQQFALCAVN